MRDNLVFSGIPEQAREEVPQCILKTRYKIDYETKFERVHWIGKRYDNIKRPRNMLRNLHTSKIFAHMQQENPRAHRFGSTNCFPEMEERRKKLNPIIQQAKSERKHTRFVDMFCT